MHVYISVGSMVDEAMLDALNSHFNKKEVNISMNYMLI